MRISTTPMLRTSRFIAAQPRLLLLYIISTSQFKPGYPSTREAHSQRCLSKIKLNTTFLLLIRRCAITDRAFQWLTTPRHATPPLTSLFAALQVWPPQRPRTSIGCTKSIRCARSRSSVLRAHLLQRRRPLPRQLSWLCDSRLLLSGGSLQRRQDR